jgi:hypothetical protein
VGAIHSTAEIVETSRKIRQMAQTGQDRQEARHVKEARHLYFLPYSSTFPHRAKYRPVFHHAA